MRQKHLLNLLLVCNSSRQKNHIESPRHVQGIPDGSGIVKFNMELLIL
jgi:hypothetical protein